MDTIYDCANLFIEQNHKKAYPKMTHSKLQKLVYYAYIYYLVSTGKRLFETNFVAGMYGPYSEELYEKYRDFKREKNEIVEWESYHLHGYEQEILYIILESYGKLSSYQLSYVNFRDNAWKQARKGLQHWESGHNLITDAIVLAHCKINPKFLEKMHTQKNDKTE